MFVRYCTKNVHVCYDWTQDRLMQLLFPIGKDTKIVINSSGNTRQLEPYFIEMMFMRSI
jgi:hypothetical protein